MSWYNHFADKSFESIAFASIKVGDKFRMDKWAGKRRRKDVVMIKLSDRRYKEFKSGKEYESDYLGLQVSKYKAHGL